jgi:broad specificity phosphatase PhoE
VLHRDDPILTQTGKKIAYKTGSKLIEKYGVPDQIYYSPFKRTSQTLDYMLKSLSSRKIEKIVFVEDYKLCRYSTNKHRPNVATEIVDNIPYNESRTAFINRITKFAKNLENNNNEIIWCITHTSVYIPLAKIYHVRIPAYVSYNDYFIVRK